MLSRANDVWVGNFRFAPWITSKKWVNDSKGHTWYSAVDPARLNSNAQYLHEAAPACPVARPRHDARLGVTAALLRAFAAWLSSALPSFGLALIGPVPRFHRSTRRPCLPGSRTLALRLRADRPANRVSPRKLRFGPERAGFLGSLDPPALSLCDGIAVADRLSRPCSVCITSCCRIVNRHVATAWWALA